LGRRRSPTRKGYRQKGFLAMSCRRPGRASGLQSGRIHTRSAKPGEKKRKGLKGAAQRKGKKSPFVCLIKKNGWQGTDKGFLPLERWSCKPEEKGELIEKQREGFSFLTSDSVGSDKAFFEEKGKRTVEVGGWAWMALLRSADKKFHRYS